MCTFFVVVGFSRPDASPIKRQDFYTHAFYVNEGATVTFMGKFRASKVPSAFWNQGYTE